MWLPALAPLSSVCWHAVAAMCHGRRTAAQAPPGAGRTFQGRSPRRQRPVSAQAAAGGQSTSRSCRRSETPGAYPTTPSYPARPTARPQTAPSTRAEPVSQKICRDAGRPVNDTGSRSRTNARPAHAGGRPRRRHGDCILTSTPVGCVRCRRGHRAPQFDVASDRATLRGALCARSGPPFPLRRPRPRVRDTVHAVTRPPLPETSPAKKFLAAAHMPAAVVSIAVQCTQMPSNPQLRTGAAPFRETCAAHPVVRRCDAGPRALACG